ncbi:PTS sugar transporter subunit IIA [Holdemanella biformis]|uniref:PTS sugar transporter subunit IIA n=1 Tax=Holdemanella biformis TaxID=1735 RepID=UPI002FDB400C
MNNRIEDYFNSNEYYAIEKIVKQIKVNNAYQSLAISECFNENLFLPEMSLQTRDEIIDLMCKRLYENNYVNENFRNQVYQREAVAPTCFSNQIAIPHSIKKDAKKSGICISILKEPILWNGYNVRLIFMFALNKSFDQVPKLYELILDAIDDKTRYQKMLKCKNFKDFMSILMKGND